jgi:hypothetical protein
MNHLKLTLVTTWTLAGLFGCSGEGGSAGTTAPTPNTQKAAAPVSAAAVLARGDHYAFDLAASPLPAEGMRKRCASEADPAACFRSICEGVTVEQVRFEGPADALTYVSYTLEAEGEHVLDRIPVEILGDDGISVQMASKDGRRYNVRVQLLDGGIAMDDPRKGRLVFRRIQQ